ncbi:hypothetical protein DL546_006012 [Coniochaeta pulveracea]|uniref:Uncharacterized protein n=1 Tax=Coniochaeta pulveracea TaxID=177199 RepID=A0A420YA34_9PEZI|nr:hypothetical protein DL546_006012 [Coniochaeta pulveracea]
MSRIFSRMLTSMSTKAADFLASGTTNVSLVGIIGSGTIGAWYITRQENDKLKDILTLKMDNHLSTYDKHIASCDKRFHELRSDDMKRFEELRTDHRVQHQELVGAYNKLLDVVLGRSKDDAKIASKDADRGELS